MSYIGNTPTNQNFVAGADQFNGTGSQTVFTLSRNVNTVFDIFVAISNVPQDPYNAYSVSGNTLTFTSAPPAGTGNIYVVYRATNVQTFLPALGSIGKAQLDIANFNGTGAAIMPVGTTAQRPGTPQSGMFRVNSNTGNPEWYDASSGLWINFNGYGAYAVEYVVVAGGGSGGGDNANALRAAGGGAGGMVYVAASALLTPGTSYSVVIGAGGAAQGGGNRGVNGGDSSFLTTTALGGGGGGSLNNGVGLNGGSGGGGAGGSAAGTGTAGQGNNGATNSNGGGGGGKGGAASSNVGGAGAANPIAGSTAGVLESGVYYFAGGASGRYAAAPVGGRTFQQAGLANTGQGGGGGGGEGGYAGGSGIVVLRYAGTQKGSGGTVTSSGGYTIHTFTTSGTFTV